MCGIAGFYGEGTRADIEAMTQTLTHRGPDDGGIYVDAPFFMGHRRLSVVDLTHGVQPMVDADLGLVLVYNGEIYNHGILREELTQKGHRFRTSHSDTETVLRSFAEWGTDCFARFNGMFALAIYEQKTGRFYLARDRFGEKPLFYAHTSHGFAFASEIRALRQWPYFDAAIDDANLQRFFAWGYMPAGRTLHPNCRSLEPGSFLCFDGSNGTLSTQTYWQFELHPDEGLTDKDEPSLLEELRSLLVQAVRRRLLSDVPLGIFLSGGIDSSSILAALCQSGQAENIAAYSIGFYEKTFDESVNAKRVANALRVPHHCQFLTEHDLLDAAFSILGRMSEPLGDPSLIPTYNLSAFTKQHVTVALSGDGGDELFAGYDPFKALKPAAWYRATIPNALHRLFRRMFGLLPCSDKNMSLDFKIKRVLRGLSYETALELPVWMGPIEPKEMPLFFENPLSAEELYEDALTLWDRHKGSDMLSQALYFFTRFYLTDDILVKVDRASMMVSLESRAVFLDNDIVEFCQRLPNRFKYRNTVRKYLLRKALEPWLPKEILELPKKGFGIPLNKWLRKLPEPEPSFGMNTSYVKSYAAEHRAQRGDNRLFLWALHTINQMSQG